MNANKDKVLVTGGNGFLGSHVVKALKKRGWSNVIVPRSRQFDLREKTDIVKLLDKEQPDYIVHLAAVVGGIGANQKNPGRFFFDNAIMGIQLMEQARKAGVKKFLTVGTICSYPKVVPVPFKEEDLWDGYPEDTNAPYGLAKKMLLVQGQAYRKQYDFNAVHLLMVNLYGPGDSLDVENSHVIPAMIRKCIDAKRLKEKSISLWGDGTPSREFLYVEDAAEGICSALEKYNAPEPVNLGTGVDITIRELAHLIAQQTGFKGEIKWDTSKPNGQPLRRLEVSKAKKQFGFTAKHSFAEGLKKTVEWYEEQLSKMGDWKKTA